MRLDPARSGQLDHALRLVDRHDRGSEVTRHTLGQLALAGPDLQHSGRA